MTENLKLLVITGLSGAGKSQALQSLEDMGFFCIDNLPPTLIEKFVELCSHSQESIRKTAVVCDLRGGEFFSALNETLAQLKALDIHYEVLFLEASDEVMVNRYKETRRRHPVLPKGNVLDGIQMERRLLTELRGKASKVIDTSMLTSAELREKIKELFGEENDFSRMTISITSFGFKYGLPLDMDTVVDVRFLPNPFYVKELKPLNGTQKPVRDYVLNNTITQEFLEKYFSLLEFMLPHYSKEGKSHLAIGIGCTGGQHRSVALAEETARYLQDKGYACLVQHRDVK